MTKTHKLFFIVSVCVATGLLQATEKQNLTIAAPLQAVDWSMIAPQVNGTPSPVTPTLNAEQATALVKAVFPAAGDQAGRTFMVHGVNYLNAKLTAKTQNWYTIDFNTAPGYETAGELGRKNLYSGQRIFGNAHLGVVYLHILGAIPAADVTSKLRGADYQARLLANIKPDTDTEAGKPAAVIRTDIDTALKGLIAGDPGNVTAAAVPARVLAAVDAGAALAAIRADILTETTTLQLLKSGASGQISLVSGDDNTTLIPWNGFYVKTGMDGLKTLAYGIEIDSKDKAPLSNLKQILTFAIAGQSAQPLKLPFDLKDTPFAAGGTFETTYTTSNIIVTATFNSSGSDTQIGTQTYDDEGRYWFDFSFVLPIKSYNDLAYDSTANGLTARTIKKNNLYAAFNFGLPRDTKNMKLQLIPVLLYGIPIAGQPLKHHLFAASVGLNYVNFFVGTSLDEKNFYHDYTKPLTGDNVFQVWRTHLTYGLNFDVGTIVKKLSATTSK
jgi:hypothetical protein